MNKQDNSKKLNSFERQIEEIDEWQRNSYNPGYFIGSGKVPLHLKNSRKSPVILIIIGILLGIPSIYNLISNFSIEIISSNIISILISSILIVGGIIRLIKRS